jgi:hypothetical protein
MTLDRLVEHKHNDTNKLNPLQQEAAGIMGSPAHRHHGPTGQNDQGRPRTWSEFFWEAGKFIAETQLNDLKLEVSLVLKGQLDKSALDSLLKEDIKDKKELFKLISDEAYLLKTGAPLY